MSLVLNTIGLILNMISALLLWKYGLLTQRDDTEQNKLAKWAMGMLFVGFLLQLCALYVDRVIQPTPFHLAKSLGVCWYW
jgi:hypothetical protein